MRMRVVGHRGGWSLRAGTYLVQFHQGLGSSDWYQRLVPIEQMTGEQEGEWKIEWRYFDQESQMTEAYTSRVTKRQNSQKQMSSRAI